MLDEQRQARLARARADAGRARQPGRGGRPRHPRGRRAAPPRRLPVGRAAAGRRRGDRLRHPLRDRPQVPARAARHRLPLRAQGADRRARAAVPRHARRGLAARRQLHDARRRTPLRELGDATSPARSRSASPPTTRSSSGLDADLGARPGARRAAPERARRDARRHGARPGRDQRRRSSPSQVAGRRAADVRSCARRRARQRLGHRGGVGAARPRRTRGIDELVRASVHYFNTEHEVDRLVELVAA